MMHNAAFEALDLDYRYLAFDVNEETLPAAVDGLKAMNARGFNLTMPDKNRMVSLCCLLYTSHKYFHSPAFTKTAQTIFPGGSVCIHDFSFLRVLFHTCHNGDLHRCVSR